MLVVLLSLVGYNEVWGGGQGDFTQKSPRLWPFGLHPPG